MRTATRAARLDHARMLVDNLDPIVGALPEIASLSSIVERSEICGQAIQSILSAAAQLVGCGRSRACYFVVDGDVLRAGNAYGGRSGRPRTVFVKGQASGDAAFAMVGAAGYRLCRDTALDPPPGWDASVPHDYRTFVAIAVVAGDRPLGMLTVDSTEPGDLIEADVRLLRVLASLLATVLMLRCLPA